jgi:N-acetyl sugar amidotransferase
MPLIGKVCTRGVWDETIPGIIFDEDGVSNYARLFDMLIQAFPRGKEGLNKWESFVEMIKSDGKGKQYDCIIGVSGGTDSSYLLYLAKEYGLRPLAVNLDNGWSSDIAVKNIKKTTAALGIDLETYVIDYEEVKDLLRSYIIAGLSWVDMPTDLAIKSILYKIASKEKVKYILRGNDFRSEGSQPEEWTYGDGRQLEALHRRFGHVRLKTYPNYTIKNLVYYALVKGIKSIYPFYYLDYTKKDAQAFLEKNFGWEYYGGHHHENLFTKFVMSYWLFEKFGIDKRKITLSAQVLSGEITREQAVEEIQKLPYDPGEVDQMLNFIAKKLDFTRQQFDEFIKAPNKTYHDYPSYNFLFNTFLPYTKPFLRFFFLHKPQSVFQSEMRNKEKKS